MNTNGSKRGQVELISHTKRKIKKNLPPIRIVGKFEGNGKCRKRKLSDYVKIRDSNSDNRSSWKKEPKKFQRANGKRLAKSKTGYVTKRN